MRIVAGHAKGRRLSAAAGATRPTSDRAREALFSSLAAEIDLDGAAVLDLFAGTGAVGLEALSRGAARVVLVESDRAAAQIIDRNVRAVGLPGARVVRRGVEGFVAAPAEQRFDLAFLDPPYAYPASQLTTVLAALAEHGWLADGAVVVVERSARSDVVEWPDELVPLRQRRYGEGVLWYGRRR